MARDPPSLIASSELRDLSLEPSDVRSARITIVHPQLRDLVLPLDRGHVLYPRGTIIEEQRWTPAPDVDDVPGPSKPTRSSNGTTRTFARLGFTPNCLSATGPIMACGGQHGELYITNLPSRTSTSSRLNAKYPTTPAIKPFCLSAVLPTMSINNSMLILPGWPEEWHRREQERRLGFLGRAKDEEEDEDEEDGVKRDADMDEAMDLDEEDEEARSSSSVATYPNTVPFAHAPRIPRLSGHSPQHIEIPTTSRRSTSFSSQSQSTRSARPSFSSSIERPGLPPLEYVSSLPAGPHSNFRFAGVPSRRPSDVSMDSRISRKSQAPGSPINEPRLLISNNDQTVKMFSIKKSFQSPAPIPEPRRREGEPNRPSTSAMRRTVSGVDDGSSLSDVSNERSGRYIDLPRLDLPVPSSSTRFGSSLGWDSIGMNEGLQRLQQDNEIFQREIDRARAHLRTEQEAWRRDRDDFERRIGMRVDSRTPVPGLGLRPDGGASRRASCPSPANNTNEGDREVRKLAKIGGARFKYAVNHSSLSPDLKTMVSVGDSSDVYLFEVLNGGREFKRIGTYNAATDAGFSTAWSKDGRKFAVASQDGQVTVWDHRSSRPLAIFHTSSNHGPGSPSFTSDLASSRMRSSAGDSSTSDVDDYEPTYQVPNPDYVLVDPVTGDSRSARSSTGKEAARAVKFSPIGSSRDLMVFTEESSNIHIIDARTFHTHVVLPVPYDVPTSILDPSSQTTSRDRSGVCGGVFGIAGIAFDPSGDWLYSGTEKTIVEWDLRRHGGGGESGTWKMA